MRPADHPASDSSARTDVDGHAGPRRDQRSRLGASASRSDALEQGLAQVADRLVARHGSETGDAHAIREWVAEAASTFGGATVTTFVPILVERRVRARLAG